MLFLLYLHFAYHKMVEGKITYVCEQVEMGDKAKNQCILFFKNIFYFLKQYNVFEKQKHSKKKS